MVKILYCLLLCNVKILDSFCSSHRTRRFFLIFSFPLVGLSVRATNRDSMASFDVSTMPPNSNASPRTAAASLVFLFEDCLLLELIVACLDGILGFSKVKFLDWGNVNVFCQPCMGRGRWRCIDDGRIECQLQITCKHTLYSCSLTFWKNDMVDFNQPNQIQSTINLLTFVSWSWLEDIPNSTREI